MANIVDVERTSLDPKYLWNAESLFADRASWQLAYDEARTAIEPLAAWAGKLGSCQASELADFFERYFALMEKIGALYVYAGMAKAVDSRDVEAQGLEGRIGSLFSRFVAALSFMEPELLAMGRAALEGLIAREPRLSCYTHYVDNLFRRQSHIRDAEIEEILGLGAEVFRKAANSYDMLVQADLRFLPASDGSQVSQGSIDKLMTSEKREVRKSSWESYCDAHIGCENALASILATTFGRDVFYSRARRFSSSLDAALFESNLDRSVFDSTICAFKKNIGIWHRYWKVRRRALGLAKLEHFDIWAPIAKRQPVVPYEKAVDWICAALEPLGGRYTEVLRRGCLVERWVDVYPTLGKSSGAFSSGWRGTFPFIKMQYTDDLSSMSTLAHELGHSMHSWHTWRSQPSVYAEYSLFLAEVASNFNQAMVRAHLFESEKDPDFQIALIEEAMENLHRYFFIMPTLARFELDMHERIEKGGSPTAQDMNGLMTDLFAEGYGGELAIDPAREGSTWAQFGHLYMNYYVFQYATGISAAHALAAPILAGDSAAAERYVDFLSAGSSDYPMRVLLKAGIDMRTPAAMEKCYEVLSSLVDRLDALTAAQRTP